MEEIQFLNYILSISAVLLSAWALWNSFKQDKNIDWHLKDLREQIRVLKNSSNNDKKR